MPSAATRDFRRGSGSGVDLRRGSSSGGSVDLRRGSSSGSSVDLDFRSTGGADLDQPSLLLRRAQIYALNRRMKAVEEKRWQSFVASKSTKVKLLSQCLAIFTRARVATALKHWAEWAKVLTADLQRQEAADMTETLQLAGLAEADEPLLRTMPLVHDARGVRRRYCLMAQARSARPSTAPRDGCCTLTPGPN